MNYFYEIKKSKQNKNRLDSFIHLLRLTTTKEPKTRSEEPKTRSEEPKTTTKEPKTRSEEPKTTTKEPKTRSEEPKTTTKEPKIRSEESKTTTSDLFCLVEYELTWGDPNFSNRANNSVVLELLN